MPQQFPRLVPIDYQRNKALVPGTPDGGFAGSIDEALISCIADIQCAQCGQLLIKRFTEAKGSPMTGWCGHFFCFECAESLYGDYEQVRNQTIGDLKPFEIKLDGRPPQALYKCKSCKKKIVPGWPSGAMIIFSHNVMLTDLYAALKKPGFLCKYCDANAPNMHPMYNSLRCQNSSSNNSSVEGNESGPTYTCVWHADRHSPSTLTIMDPSIQAEELGSNQRLASLDRSARKAFAPFYHCACCSNYLHNDTKWCYQYSHLECGHFVGSRCAQIVRQKITTNDGVYCIFCNKDYMQPTGKRCFKPNSQIAGKVVERINLFPCTLKTCDKCNVEPCKSMFSSAVTAEELLNHGVATDKACQWCIVEHKLNRNCMKNQKVKYNAIAPAAYDNNIQS